jgi:hypothetical protein
MNIKLIWRSVRGTYLGTREKVLDFRNHLQKEWMSESTWDEIKVRKQAKVKINQSRTRQQK